jgi:glycosyltransferase involved in cell wall biosynthesis
MLLSALMVTRPASLPWLPQAIGDFARQTLQDRELVVVHDGGDEFTATLRVLCDAHGVDAVIDRAAPGQPLGALRNRSVELARGTLVAQWDDDDRNHPQRLARQVDALHAQRAVAAFSTEQLHWFPARATLFWEDWQRDAWPLDVVQGTLVGVRAALPRYAGIARGEDSALLLALAQGGATVARISDIGWSYVYTFHGANAWDAAHHVASATAKALAPARLLARESLLRARLAEYDPPLPALHVPCGRGAIAIGAHPASSGRNRRASTA